jgi:hypothetical protein
MSKLIIVFLTVPMVKLDHVRGAPAGRIGRIVL